MLDVVAFVARTPGLLCLRALLGDHAWRVTMVYTHRRKPTSEDPARAEREDYREFADLCAARSVPLYVKDTFREAADLREIAAGPRPDFIVSCNWKFRIPPETLAQARVGTVNLHRGKLPEYRGLEPIKRALRDGWPLVYLSAHEMEAEYDAGRLLHEDYIPADRRSGETLDEAVERLKVELHPLYPVAMTIAMNRLLREHDKDEKGG